MAGKLLDQKLASSKQDLVAVGVPEAELEACAAQSLSDGAIVYNGKFAAQERLVLDVYRAAF